MFLGVPLNERLKTASLNAQWNVNPEPMHFLLGDPAKVRGDDGVLDDDEDGGRNAVVVEGLRGGIVAGGMERGLSRIVEGLTARRSSSRKNARVSSPRLSMKKASGWTDRGPSLCWKWRAARWGGSSWVISQPSFIADVIVDAR